MRSMYPALLLVALAVPASAQSFCNVVAASEVKAALGLAGNLTAKPNTEGGNGCDYTLDGAVTTTVKADASDAAGMVGTIFDIRLKNLGPDAQIVSGVGETAYYDYRTGQNIPKDHTQAYTQQSIVFRAKGKIVSYIILTPKKGVPKAGVLALGTLTVAKPINTLKDPK
jgi:hypothetical protein